MNPAPSDLSCLVRQLGKAPRGRVSVVRRCRYGWPRVIRTDPAKGFFTASLYWLSCPWLCRNVGRLEGSGVLNEARRIVSVEPGRAGHAAAQVDYKTELQAAFREAAGEPPRPAVWGIDGSSNPAGLKCLHSHLAYALVGGTGPVAEMILERVGQLDCPDERCRDGEEPVCG